MNKRHLVPAALVSLLAATLPAHAQTGMEAFNPFAMLAPIMTPLGAMLVPMISPMNTPTNTPLSAFNPAMFNPGIFNPAMFNPAMLNPAMLNPAMQPAGYGAGMVPFTGLQATPQSYYGTPTANAYPGMSAPMASPYPGMPQFQMPALPTFPMFPGFPLPFPVAR